MSASAPSAPPQRTGGLDGVFAWCRSLGIVRRSDASWLGGVCSGIAARYQIDPLVVRAGVIALSLIGGIGVVAYLVGWAVLPDQRDRLLAEEGLRRGDAGGIALLLLIVAAVVGAVSDRSANWVVVPALVVGWFVIRSSRHPGGSCGRQPEATSPADRRDDTSDTGGGIGKPVQDAPTWPPGGAPPPVPPEGPVVPAAAGLPHGMGPGRTWAPADGSRASTDPQPGRGAASAPVRFVHEKRRAGGVTLFVVAAGLAAVGYGIGLAVASSLSLTRPPEIFAGSIAVSLVAVALVVAGLRGWRAPVTGTAAVLAAVVLAVGTAAPDIRIGDGIGERFWAPTGSVDREYRLTVGEATFDLTNVPPGSPAASTIASVGVGELTIRVPSTMSVVVDATVSLGDITTRQPGVPTSTSSGPSSAQTVRLGTGEPTVAIRAHVGLGAIVIDRYEPRR